MKPLTIILIAFKTLIWLILTTACLPFILIASYPMWEYRPEYYPYSYLRFVKETIKATYKDLVL